MKMTDKLFRAIMRNLHAYVLLINRDFTVFYTNYYDITGAVKPAILLFVQLILLVFQILHL